MHSNQMKFQLKSKERIYNMFENLKLVDKWDKTFPKSEKVNHCKITFHNKYGIELAADI